MGRFLSPFQNQYIAYADTEEFFHAIYDSYTDVNTSTADCGTFRRLKEELKQIVDEQIDKDMYHFLNLFRLCSQLNINPGRFYPNWIERIKQIFDIWNADGDDILWRMSVVNGQKNDGIIDDIYSNNWHDKRLYDTGMVRKLRPYMAAWDKKHKTKMLMANSVNWGYGFPLTRRTIRKYVDKTAYILENKLTDESSSDISRGTCLYLCGWQTKLAIKVYQLTGGRIKGRMLFLKSCIDCLLQYPFTRFRYRTHYLSLCRQAAYIDAAIHRGKNGFEGDIQKEWDICMQTPILFDAGQVVNSRLLQISLFGVPGSTVELEEIRKRIHDLRKENGEKS